MKRILFLLAILTIAISCEEEFEPGATATKDLAGEWWVQLYNSDASAVLWGYERIATYNTSADTEDSLWVNDYDHIFYGFRVKVPANLDQMTFGSSDIQASYVDSLFTVNNGEIIEDGAVTPGGLTVDSIYFEVTDYSDTSSYVLAGYRHTGWPEDNH